MPQYRVSFQATVWNFGHVTVEADSKDEAEKIAHWKDVAYWDEGDMDSGTVEIDEITEVRDGAIFVS